LSENHRYRWVILGVAFLAVLAAIGLGRFGYSAILPSMREALGLSATGAGSLASWNLGGYVLMAAAGGFLAARFGARKIVTIGLVAAAAGMAVTGLSGGLVAASAARLLTGLGSGLVLVPAIAMMATWFEPKRRGFASAVVASGAAPAVVAVGPLVPRVIAAGGSEGWRLAWYVFSAATMAIAVVTLIVLRDRPLALRAEAATTGGSNDHARTRVPGEEASLRPHWRSVYRSGYAWHLGGVYFLYGFAYMIYFVFFQARLTHDLAYSSERAGTLYMILGIASLVCGVLWGNVSDRIGRKQALAMICGVQAVAAALFAFAPSTAGLIASVVIFGLTSLSVPGIVGAACGDFFGPELASASLGLVTLFIGVGQAAGPVVAGRLKDASESYTSAYALAAGLFVVAAMVALFLREAQRSVSCASQGAGLSNSADRRDRRRRRSITAA
jgi:MFS family permease